MRAEIRGRGLQRSHLLEISASFRGKTRLGRCLRFVRRADAGRGTFRPAPGGGRSGRRREGDVQAGVGRGTFASRSPGPFEVRRRAGRGGSSGPNRGGGGGMGGAAKPEPTIGPAGAAAVRTAWLSGTRMLHEGVACRFVSLRALDGSFAQPHAIDGAETVLRRRPLHVSGRRPRFPSERNVLWNFPSFPAA